jgi:Flp pilus assembly protein TadD
VRPYRPTDLDDVCDICVRTADAGGDARGIYASDRLMGDLFAAPYVQLEPAHAYVVDDGTGRAVGYIIGTADTARFVTRYREEWIPHTTDRCPVPPDPPVTPEDTMLALHHYPERMLVPEIAETRPTCTSTSCHLAGPSKVRTASGRARSTRAGPVWTTWRSRAPTELQRWADRLAALASSTAASSMLTTDPVCRSRTRTASRWSSSPRPRDRVGAVRAVPRYLGAARRLTGRPGCVDPLRWLTVVLSCSGWNCTRLISVSVIPGGNPVAQADPEHFSVTFLICPDCHATFCDRCVPRTPFHARRCRDCVNELVDGAHRGRVVSGAKADYARAHAVGLEHGRAGRLAEAVFSFEEAVRLRPTYVSAHFHRGVALNLLGLDPQSIEAFEQVTQIDPTHAQAMYDLGGVYRKRGDSQRALDAYNQALGVQPRFVAARINRAVTLIDLGRYQDALAACDRAIQIDIAEVAADRFPHARSFAHSAKGVALLKLDRYALALDAFDQALELRDDPQTWHHKAAVLQRLGRHDEAQAAAARAGQA